MELYPEIHKLFDSLPFDIKSSHVLRTNPVTQKIVGKLRSDSVLVELTPNEYINMAHLAMYRLVESQVKSFSHNNEASRLITNDIQGIMGEAAVMKASGRNLSELAIMQDSIPHQRKGEGDMPTENGIEIRTTTGLISKVSPKYGASFYSRLIFRDGDDVSKRYVLVLGIGLVYEIAGWLPGSELKRDEWAGQGDVKRTPAWMAPIEALRPIRELLPVKHSVKHPQLVEMTNPVKPKFDLELEMLGRPTSVEELWRQAKMAHGELP